MKTKENIKILLQNGLSSEFIVNLNENQIKSLVERFGKNKKEENKEAVTKIMQTTTYSKQEVDSMKQKEGGLTVDGNGKVSPNPDGSVTVTKGEQTEGESKMMKYVAGLDPDQDIPTESEIKEKFESQAQRNFFWAKCNTSKGVKKKKWCELAREFEDSTSEKQSENMPEKKHPEKTVKYKKKETNENLQKFIENTIVEMLEKEVDARMSKKDLLEAIKKTKKKNDSFVIRKPKKVTMFSDEAPMELPIGQLFSIGKSKK
jgi:uncharacterized protein YehS (DUF1456 family)